MGLKILHLVLFSTNLPEYVDMYRISREYYNNLESNVTTLYYTFKTEKDNANWGKDILFFNGNDTFIPGILEKTILAMKFCLETSTFDFLVRSNISSIVDFDKLLPALEQQPQQQQQQQQQHYYYNGIDNNFNLQWLDFASGIVDTTHYGLCFVGGTCIILNRYAVECIVRDRAKLDYSIIDDIALGIYAKEHQSQSQPQPQLNNQFAGKKLEIMDDNNTAACNLFTFGNSVTLYRIKSHNRKIDVNKMRSVVSFLLFRRRILKNISSIRYGLASAADQSVDVLDACVARMLTDHSSPNYLYVPADDVIRPQYFGGIDPFYGIVKSLFISRHLPQMQKKHKSNQNEQQQQQQQQLLIIDANTPVFLVLK